MAVGLWAANSNGDSLIEENTSLLRFKRKVTTSGSARPPTLSSTEVVAIRKTAWDYYNASRTYYIFEFGASPINYGLEINDSSGNTQVSLSEGYARIVGANKITVNPNRESTQSFTNYPAGTYAVMYPYLSGGIRYSGGYYYLGLRENFIVNSNGFITRMEGFLEDHVSGWNWVPNVSAHSKTILLIDVAGL